FAYPALRNVGGRYTVAIGFIVLWSALFIVMTLMRLRATPVVASAGLLLWIAYRLAVAIVRQAGWPLTVDPFGEVVLAAGFCRSRAEGVRPNAYYRHRLPAP